MMGRMMGEYWLPLLGQVGFTPLLKHEPDVPDEAVTPAYCAEHNWLIGSPDTVATKLHRASWWLAPDLAVRRGGYRHQTSVGAEVCEVAAGDDGATAVTLTDVDGWQTRARLDGELAPGNPLALTLPALASAAAGVRPAFPALTIERGEVRPGTMALACVDTPAGDTVAAGTVAPESGAAVPAGERIVELRLDRPGQRIEQTCRVGSDGQVLAIAQLLGMVRRRREFTPVSER
jgi:hypothetical protein